MFISIQTLNAIKQQWIINGDIIYPPKTWCDYPPPPTLRVQSTDLKARGPGLLEGKACGVSHLSSAQWPNEPVLYWEPTR